jgi:hypothetical protein
MKKRITFTIAQLMVLEEIPWPGLGGKQGVVPTRAEVLSGVLQDSVLGPTLFLIFYNNLESASRTTEIFRKFAENSKLVQTPTTSLEE